ncbi:TonB-dependent receptor [Asticcacaulis solisilvae]|uniref:TonB-dependent receptor n=1 Tax=Asticcacaulis solisilvae TaxID=1217274 RepID=UPI003FD773F6
MGDIRQPVTGLRKAAWLTSVALLAFGLGGHAMAQTSQPAPPDAKPAAKTDPAKKSDDKATDDKSGGDNPVIVTGEKPLNRIDRQVYDNTKDPDSKTATAADALNKVPGVSADNQGNVTLRGNNVQILINGKPSPLMQGDNRAAALQAMPSSMISSIEVSSNPGSQYGSEGSGGVINLVTRTSGPPGYLANLTGQVMSNGGATLNGFAQYNQGKLSATGFGMLGDQKRNGGFGSSLSQLDSSGHPTRTTQGNGESRSDTHIVLTNGNIDYMLNTQDSLTGQLNYMRIDNASDYTGNSAVYDAAGSNTERYTGVSASHYLSDSTTLGTSWNHKGAKPGETLKVDYRLTRVLTGLTSDTTNTYSLSNIPSNSGPRASGFLSGSAQTTGIFSTDYNTSFGDDQLTTGVQITHDDVKSHSQVTLPYTPGSGTPVTNSALTNAYVYTQTLSAAYVTWQKALGQHWTVLGGVRSETLDFNSTQVQTGTTVHVRYTKLNPSFFATYIISQEAKIRFNYSHRLQRPTPQDLNPSVVYQGSTAVTVGSTSLKPQETDSFEAAYEYGRKDFSWSLRGYHLQSYKVLNPVSSFIADPQNAGNQVVLTTRRNDGTSNQTGVQANFTGVLNKKWRVNATTNVYEVHMVAPNVPGRQSQLTVATQLNLTYTAANKDAWSVRFNDPGRTLTGEGYRLSPVSSALTYSHDLNGSTKLIVAVQEPLRATKSASVRHTSFVDSWNINSQQAPTFYISLSRRFGSGVYAPPKNTPAQPANGPGSGSSVRYGS